jgi:DNA-binding NarL/FixJ family response regulator
VRELEVLGLAAQGLGNRVIAQHLFLSEKKTVAHHVSAVLRKLDVRARAGQRPGDAAGTRR